MSSDISTYTPLKTIVAYALDELDKGVGDFDKCWLLGLRAHTEITQQVSGQPTTYRIPVDGNMTAQFPTSCLSWSKIGILDDKGQINTLKVNNALTTWHDTRSTRVGDLTPDITNSVGSQALVPYYANYYYGGGMYQLYGIGGGMVTYGDCKVDEQNRVVILNPDFKYDSIMFECLTVPEKDNDYVVFTCLQEAIISFIKWKLKLGTREEYYAAVTAGRRALPKKKFILQTFNQVIRESHGMKLKA